MSHIYKKDANHEQIADIYRWYCPVVIDTSWSRGRLLDLIVIDKNDKVRFVEIKNGNEKLTKSEKKFIEKYGMHCRVIRSLNEALKDAQC
jgi:hypothetical protein